MLWIYLTGSGFLMGTHLFTTSHLYGKNSKYKLIGKNVQFSKENMKGWHRSYTTRGDAWFWREWDRLNWRIEIQLVHLVNYYNYTAGMRMDPMSRTLGKICTTRHFRFGVVNMQYTELTVKNSSSHTSPNLALIFKGTNSSARVTPTLTIAVAAPASWAALSKWILKIWSCQLCI